MIILPPQRVLSLRQSVFSRHVALAALASLFILPSSIWGLLALWHQLPLPTAGLLLAVGLWCALTLALLIRLWRDTMRRNDTERGSTRVWSNLLIYTALLALLLLWWHSLAPAKERDWAADVAQLTHGTIEGDQITLHNVRNFDWRSETDFSPQWQTRHYNLQQLTSVDLLTSYWAGPSIAHTLVSFGFSDGQFVTFSVEIRKEADEAFSEIGGFFKAFELSIVATDERDSIRVRTNIRGEDVYLYRVNLAPEARRELLLSYIERANTLSHTPAFYHTLTANCTTIVFDMMQQIVPQLPLDYRLLLSGYLPEYAFDAGGLMPNHSLDQLRQLGRITERAKRTDDSNSNHSDFSHAIRQGVPGWDNYNP